VNDASAILALLDKHAPDINKVAKIGLSPQRVRELTNPPAHGSASAVTITPEETRRLLAKNWRKLSHGGGRIPGYVVAEMAADYARLKSLDKTGALYGRTGEAMRYIFRSHGVPIGKSGGANRSLPPGLVAAMAADYARLRSLRKVGALYDRSMSVVRKILILRGVKLAARCGKVAS
jgi:hypothetical protein